jgi:acyl-CoA reductase-like NAD-dependent aldehyde dehydrogenase
VNLVLGSGAEPGAALVEHPAVRAISFTGSTAVGIKIYRNAAPGMKRLLLELGGKGAVIVRDDVDVDQVATAVSRTWTVQSGQVCLTPARILADANVHDALVDRLLSIRHDLRHGDPRSPGTTVGPLISDVQRDRVAQLVATAEDEGCEIHQKADLPTTGFFHPATLVTGCDPDNTLMQNEAFGPVLCVMRTTDDEEAVQAANSTQFGLSDYIFSADTERARELARHLDSAQVGINTVARHPEAPFGGNKASGLGRSGATFALDSYTDLRSIASPHVVGT